MGNPILDRLGRNPFAASLPAHVRYSALPEAADVPAPGGPPTVPTSTPAQQAAINRGMQQQTGLWADERQAALAKSGNAYNGRPDVIEMRGNWPNVVSGYGVGVPSNRTLANVGVQQQELANETTKANAMMVQAEGQRAQFAPDTLKTAALTRLAESGDQAAQKALAVQLGIAAPAVQAEVKVPGATAPTADEFLRTRDQANLPPVGGDDFANVVAKYPDLPARLAREPVGFTEWLGLNELGPAVNRAFGGHNVSTRVAAEGRAARQFPGRVGARKPPTPGVDPGLAGKPAYYRGVRLITNPNGGD